MINAQIHSNEDKLWNESVLLTGFLLQSDLGEHSEVVALGLTVGHVQVEALLLLDDGVDETLIFSPGLCLALWVQRSNRDLCVARFTGELADVNELQLSLVLLGNIDDPRDGWGRIHAFGPVRRRKVHGSQNEWRHGVDYILCEESRKTMLWDCQLYYNRKTVLLNLYFTIL